MEQFEIFLTNTFNNKEIATGIWIGGALIFFLRSSDMRSSFWSLIKMMFAPRLLLVFATIACNDVILCWLLMQIGLWSTDQIPATILWYFMTGCFMGGRALQAAENENYFKKLFKNSFKVGGIFELIVVAKSFSLWVELILVPVVALLGMIVAILDLDPKKEKIKKPFEFFLSVIGVVLIWNFISQVLEQPDQFFTMEIGRNLIAPVLLTIGSIPIFYILYCYSNIEIARIRINLKTFQSEEVKAYARKRFFRTFGLRPWLLHRAVREFGSMPAKTKEGVIEIVNEIRKYEREAASPPSVDSKLGWSPFLMCNLLKDLGLKICDYHKIYDKEYGAESISIDLDNQMFPSRAIFYLKGEKGLVRELKIMGRFDGEFMSEESLDRFRVFAQAMCDRALSEHELNFETLIPSLSPFDHSEMENGARVRAWADIYPNGRGVEVFLTLSR